MTRPHPSRLASSVVAFIALLALLGWIFHSQLLAGLLPGATAMNPVTALCFLLCAASLSALAGEYGNRHRPLARALVLVVLSVGLYQLVVSVAALPQGLDTWLLRGYQPGPYGPEPNRVAPNTALALVLSASSLLALYRRTPDGVRWSQGLAFTAGCVNLLALVGYGYSVLPFYGVSGRTPMALTTAIAFSFLVVGLLTASGAQGLLAAFSGDTFGSILARRLLAPALMLPLVLGFFRLWGERLGWYNTEFGLAFMVVSCSFSLGLLVVWTARLLQKSEGKRQEAERAVKVEQERLEERVAERTRDLQASNDRLVEEVRRRELTEAALRESEEAFRLLSEGAADTGMYALDPQGHIVTWNPAAERMTGYRGRDILGEQISAFYPPEENAREKAIADLQAAGEQGQIERHGWRLRAGGQMYWAHSTIVALRGDDGELRGFTCLDRDRT